MKKIISIAIILLALLGLTRCTLAENERIEQIPCPDIKIDTVLVPGWDMQPQ